MNTRLVSKLSDDVQELKRALIDTRRELHDVRNEYAKYKMWHDATVRGIPVKPIEPPKPLELVKPPEDIL